MSLAAAKAGIPGWLLSARLKSCPVTKPTRIKFFHSLFGPKKMLDHNEGLFSSFINVACPSASQRRKGLYEQGTLDWTGSGWRIRFGASDGFWQLCERQERYGDQG